MHPDWKDKEPFASFLKGDLKGALAGGDCVPKRCIHSGRQHTK